MNSKSGRSVSAGCHEPGVDSGICRSIVGEAYLKKRVVLIDHSYPFRKQFRRCWEVDHLCNREAFADIFEFETAAVPKPIDVLILEVSRESEKTFGFLKDSKRNDIVKCIPICQCICTETLKRAVQLGADDFLVKTKHLNLVDELRRILKDSTFLLDTPIRGSIFSSGLLRCAGLSESEELLLECFYPHCPSMKETAYISGKSEGYVRKAFSNIYRKLSVSNSAQMSQLLTLLGMLEH